MIKPNFMDKMLDGVQVEWRMLEEIGGFVRGTGLQKSDFAESGVGCIHYGQIYTYYGNFAYQTKSFVAPTLATKLRKAQKGDLIIATTSENIEDVCKPLVWLGEDEVCVSGETYVFKHNQNPKYLAYYLQTPMFFDYKKQNRTGTKVIRVHGDILGKFEIPIPCPENPEKSLEIQAEIVRILDSFTELTAELTAKLTAELTARKKQYEYYSDKLLTFDEGEVEWKTLNDIVEFRNGKGHEKVIVDDGKYIVVNSKFISTNGKVKKYSNEQISPLFTNDILMVMSDLPNGRALAKCYLVCEDDRYTLNQRIGAFKNIEKKVNTKFLFYVLNRNRQLLKYDNGVDQTNLKKDDILNIQIPIPPLAEQERIVSILDRFDTLVNDITSGLPREIELRKKQYEYYRNLLLSFPKSEVGV